MVFLLSCAGEDISYSFDCLAWSYEPRASSPELLLDYLFLSKATTFELAAQKAICWLLISSSSWLVARSSQLIANCQLLFFGAGGSLYGLFQVKQAANRCGQYILLLPFWKSLQFTGQRSSNALGNMASQCG